ncbi:30S ribosomal protein S4 [Candidatus Micrarchaeota archaeon]|nr:30S ribosomal protein S4 [Candidatus Micrarchaeota archaeon]
MGDPGRLRKRFEGPKRLWDKKRIDDEKALRTEFGLKNARELWRMQTMLRRIRREARRLLSSKGKDLDRRQAQLLDRIKKFLIQNPDAKVDDVLLLTTKDILGRRLQTIVTRKHLAKTMTQARQMITHGHIAVNGNKVSSPSYLVSFSEEDHVSWYKKPIQSTAPVENAKVEGKPVATDAKVEPSTSEVVAQAA